MITWTGTDKNENPLTSAINSFEALKYIDPRYRLDKMIYDVNDKNWLLMS